MNTTHSNRNLGYALSGALALALLSGCTAGAAPVATASAAKAENALAEGRSQQAVTHAEAAVQAEPRSAHYRAMLGDAYLDAGRFASAAASFADAAMLGDDSARTALSHALALTGAGDHAAAALLLDRHASCIAPTELGLALALAGQPDRGIQLMGAAIRGGENTVKMRQNLAYSYALAGMWREARIMASQDVPANRIDDRIEQWSRMAHPDAWQLRVAALLDVPAHVADAGQPAHLALSNHPSVDQLGAEALALAPAYETPALEQAAYAFAAPVAAELPPVSASPAYAAPAFAPPPALAAPVAAASAPAPFATPAAIARTDDPRAEAAQDHIAAMARAQAAFDNAFPAPARLQQAAPAPRQADRVAAAPAPSGAATHLVQLGSFSSEQGARRALGIYQDRYPELHGRQLVITEAVVRGQRFWRVSAAGFGQADSREMCGRVKARGEGCFAYAESRPLPGAVDRTIRFASR